MAQIIRNKNRQPARDPSVPFALRRRHRWPDLLLAAGAAYLSMAGAVAQTAPAIVPPRPEEGLPLNWRMESVPPARPRDDQATPLPPIADQVLPSPIRRIDVRAPQFSDDITGMLARFIGQDRLSGQELEQVRGQIWSLYRRHGRLVRIDIEAKQAPDAGVLEVRVTEIRVHAVLAQQDGEGAVDPAVLDEILASAKADLAAGGVFDLDRLEMRIKRRLFLGDVNLRASLVPVSPDTLDVKLLVGAKPRAPLRWFAQVDNYSMRTYGTARYTAGLSAADLLRAGDRTDVVATGSGGMRYGRLSYEFPLVSIGARLAGWVSRVDYEPPAGVEGRVSQWGADLIYPLYYSSAAVMTGYVGFDHSHQVDAIEGVLPINDKTTRHLQARVDLNYAASASTTLHGALALQKGRLDLSALPSALLQDQLSARSNGSFTKLNWSAGWHHGFGPANRFDTRVQLKGQMASKNLDQGEKFALGGASAVRAYAATEAMGDSGYVGSLELGYRPLAELRVYGFYDRGRSRLSRDPWSAGAVPLGYTLQGAGVGLSYAYRALHGALVYARQVGSNPGLGANGLDAEGESDRYRVWLTVGAQF